jgi:uncharacterized damage-inducible protein DinB
MEMIAVIEYFARMFRFGEWADQRTLESMRSTPSAHADALPLYAHLVAAEHVWLSRLEHRSPRHPVWPTLTIEECGSLAAENYEGYRSFLERIGDNDLNTAIRYVSSQGQEFVSPVVDILTQVIVHGPYHRGQIAKAIGRSGGDAINTDYITFARESSSPA